MNNSLTTTAQIDDVNAAIQAVYDFINQKLQGKLFTLGSTTPGADAQSLPWIRTDANNNIIGIYTFNTTSQKWVSPNPTPLSGNERRLWTGTESQLWAYDGGDGTDPSVNSPTETTGAMWQVDHAADFKMPIGPGTNIPTGTTIAVGQTGGEEKHILLAAEHEHTHVTGRMKTNSGSGADDGYMLQAGAQTADGTGRRITGGSSSDVEAPLNTLTGNYLATAAVDGTTPPTAHNNMPPFIGMFVVQRTARKYYVAA
jgi:hypothetical protein